MTRNILAIDPGPTQSAYVWLRDGKPDAFAKVENESVLAICAAATGADVVFEQVASYGKPVGAEVFETVFWTGQFFHAARQVAARVSRLPRTAVKMHLCHSMNGVNDSVIRQALIDRYGPGKEKAIGRKNSPGPCYGVNKDVWQALALGVTHFDQSPALEG